MGATGGGAASATGGGVSTTGRTQPPAGVCVAAAAAAAPHSVAAGAPAVRPVSAAQGLTCTGAAGAVEATAAVELITMEPARTAAITQFIRTPAMTCPLPARSIAA